MLEPQRIISLVPSDSYTLIQLGLRERMLACTEYCNVDDLETVGGTKNADVDRIVALAPDLVVANQEENRRVDIERLRDAGIEVLLSFPKTVREGLTHAEHLAAMFPSIDNTKRLDDARDSYQRCAKHAAEPVPSFVPIWMDPLMTVHADTFISDCLELVGGRNVFSDRVRRYPLGADLGKREPLPAERTVGRDTRYPRVTLSEVVERAPRLILLPDEPHEFSQADAAVFRELPLEAEIHFCDGKDLMWYGLRSLEGLTRLCQLMEICREKY